MSKRAFAVVAALAAASLSAQEPFAPTWESLARHEAAPEWFRDAKFGIYFHWGVYSVPAFSNEWYPRNMHRKDHPAYAHHVATYGDPSEFGYHDFVPRFTAEHFDADEWAALFEKAGARFAGPVAEHHDGFAMWDSELTPWNAADRGPKRDILGELATAIRARGMKVVATFHHARNQGHYPRVDGWPTTSEDPELQLLYGNVPREQFLDLWLGKLVEVVDKYEPDLMWFDSWLDQIPDDYRLRYLAHYFNSAASWGRDVVVTCKQQDLPLDIAVEDFEKGRADRLKPNAWLTDDTISLGSWCYTEDLQIKPFRRVLHDFLDIVSKNGQLLLNISPKADGTIPDDQRAVLLAMGDWLRVAGEAIYGTRPWQVFGEGPTRLERGGHFVGELRYGAEDLRYTRSKDGKTVYVIALGWPEDERLAPRSIAVRSSEGARVELLGHHAPLRFDVASDAHLVVHLPDLAIDDRPTREAFAFALRGFDLAVDSDALFATAKSIRIAPAAMTLDGTKIRVETHDGLDNVGFWDDPSESVHFLFRVGEAGEYAIRGRFNAAAGASELGLRLVRTAPAPRPEPGNRGIGAPGVRPPPRADFGVRTAAVPATASWRGDPVEVDFGRVHLEPGIFHGTLLATRPWEWKAVNVYEIRAAGPLAR